MGLKPIGGLVTLVPDPLAVFPLMGLLHYGLCLCVCFFRAIGGSFLHGWIPAGPVGRVGVLLRVEEEMYEGQVSPLIIIQCNWELFFIKIKLQIFLRHCFLRQVP
jgi:hypothetical protein